MRETWGLNAAPRGPVSDSGAGNGSPDEKAPTQSENPEELANNVLNFLAERLGTVGRYGHDLSEHEVAKELYRKFGAYDTKAIYDHWMQMKEAPEGIQNPILREIVEQEKANNGFSDSYVHDILAFCDPALVPVREKVIELQTTLDPVKRREKVNELKELVGKTVAERGYTVYTRGSDRDTPLTLERMEEESYLSVSSRIGSSVQVNDIAEALMRANADIRFDDTVGYLDRQRLREDTLRYGAKGANLENLKRVQEGLRQYQYSMSLSFEIPEYKLVPTSVYDKWDAGERIMPELQETFNWIKGRKVILRSSAVYSEDAENATGAGIYKSIVLEAGANAREFLTKVKEVYKSTDSDAAREYRREHGIRDEKMGLVVQEFKASAPTDRGYINTVMKNVPQLMEIAYEDGLRPLIVKEQAMEAIVLNQYRAPIMHYEIDNARKYEGDIRKLALIATMIEKHYGQPIQIEFLRGKMEGEDSWEVDFMLQARFLPAEFSVPKHYEFPAEESIFEGRGVGAFDLTLPVLSNMADNTDREGVVVFQASTFYTTDNVADKAIRKTAPSSCSALQVKAVAISRRSAPNGASRLSAVVKAWIL